MRKIFRHGHREEPVFGGRRRFVAGRSRRTGLRRCRPMEGRAGSLSVRRGPGRTGRLPVPVSRRSGTSSRSGSGKRTVATGSRSRRAIAPGPTHADQVHPSLQISTVPGAPLPGNASRRGLLWHVMPPSLHVDAGGLRAWRGREAESAARRAGPAGYPPRCAIRAGLRHPGYRSKSQRESVLDCWQPFPHQGNDAEAEPVGQGGVADPVRDRRTLMHPGTAHSAPSRSPAGFTGRLWAGSGRRPSSQGEVLTPRCSARAQPPSSPELAEPPPFTGIAVPGGILHPPDSRSSGAARLVPPVSGGQPAIRQGAGQR